MKSPNIADHFWIRSKPSASKQWTADELYLTAIEYFNWSHNNPLYELRPFAYKGDSWVEEVPKARAFTERGLCTFLGISLKEWQEMSKADHLAPITSWAEQVIHQQKFELAAADLLNAGFIARDLGLSDKRELGGIPGQPLEVSAREQLLDRLSGIASSLGTDGTDQQPE